MPAQKMQKAVRADVRHRLPFGRECRRKERQFPLHSRDPHGGDEGQRIEIGVLAMKKSWIVYRLQHYGDRRLFDFLLRTDPTVDAT